MVEGIVWKSTKDTFASPGFAQNESGLTNRLSRKITTESGDTVMLGTRGIKQLFREVAVRLEISSQNNGSFVVSMMIDAILWQTVVDTPDAQDA